VPITLEENMKSKGFTLIEVAIVMLIITMLIGASILPMRAQRESSNIQKALKDLRIIEEAIYGFAIAQGRLPCPASRLSVPLGTEDTTVNGTGLDCDQPIGFVPAATLGLTGEVSCDGYLLDPWKNPYRLSITSIDNNAVDGMDFISNGEMTGIGIGNLAPDINVCIDQACATPLATNAAAVIFSMGGNWATSSGVDQDENAGEGTHNRAAGCGGGSYGISNDNIYVSHGRIEQGANQFDDVIIWMSPNILYAKMLAAGQLP